MSTNTHGTGQEAAPAGARRSRRSALPAPLPSCRGPGARPRPRRDRALVGDQCAVPGGSIDIAGRPRTSHRFTRCPDRTSALVAHEIMWQIYDSLIYLHEDGTVHPGLATEWAIAEDN